MPRKRTIDLKLKGPYDPSRPFGGNTARLAGFIGIRVVSAGTFARSYGMLIWRGWGLLSLVIAAISGGLGSAIGGGGSKLQAYGAAAGLIVGAIVNWFVGQSFNHPLRVAAFDYGKRHSLFFIPMEWWSLAMIGIATILLLG